MPSNDTQQSKATVPVKKQDGTVVRMTLDELKAYKQGQQASVQQDMAQTAQPSSVSVKKSNTAQVYPIPKKLDDTALAKDKKETVEQINKPESTPTSNAGFADLASLREELRKHTQEAAAKQPKAKQEDVAMDIPVAKPMPRLNETTQELATTTPVKNAFVAEAAAHAQQESANHWDKEDHMSPLDDSLHEDINLPHKGVSDVTAEMVEQVKKVAKVSVSDDLVERFNLAIIARLKGIRSNDETIQYLTMDSQSGGIGLTQEQAKQLIQSIEQIDQGPRPISEDIEPLVSKPPVRQEKNIAAPKAAQQSYVPLHNPLAKPTPSAPRMRQGGGSKPLLQDIERVQPAARVPMPAHDPGKTIGPVDEIARLNVADFRRFSSDPQEAAKQIQQKFAVLQKESYLLFLEAQKLWWQSPLYMTYISMVIDALHSGKSIEEEYAPQAGQEALNESEFAAMVQLNALLNS